MKKIFVILFTSLVIFSFADDKWGNRPSWVSGNVNGTDTTVENRAIGLDPENAIVWIYVKEKFTKPEDGSRHGMAVGKIHNREFLIDMAQCEDQYMPDIGSTLILMIGKTIIDEETKIARSFFGAQTFVKKFDSTKEPEYVNDIVMYELPVPNAYYDYKNGGTLVKWPYPNIQPIGNEEGSPIFGYNVYYGEQPEEKMFKLNSQPIGWEQNQFFHTGQNEGFYSITLVMQNGIELGKFDMGPDGAPGIKGVDDNGNGIVDEFEEIGYGDDVYSPFYSALSNKVMPSSVPDPITDLIGISSDRGIYLQWSKSPDPTIYKYDIYRNNQYIDSVFKRPLYHVNTVEEGEFHVITVNSHEQYSASSNKVKINSFDGRIHQVDINYGKMLLFPEWSRSTPFGYPSPCIAYTNNGGEINSLMVADLERNKYTLVNDIPIYWASGPSWGYEDKYIYFTVVDKGTTHIYVQTTNYNKPNTYQKVSFGWGGWSDPHWTDDFNQFTKKDMLAVTIDGDIWVIPTPDGKPEDLIRITQFSPYEGSPKDHIKIFQPKWSPDNISMAFIARQPGPTDMAVVSDIYIIKNVQNIIKYGDVINSLEHPEIERLTASNATMRYKPIWSPSWSIDQTMISYVVDVNNSFANYVFSGNYSHAIDQLRNANFDAYVFERNIGTWPAGYPQMNTTGYSEGFVSWAKTGGDRFVQSSLDISKGFMTLITFIDPSIHGSGGKMALKSETFNTITVSDRSRTSLTIEKDHFNQFSAVSIFPVQEQPGYYPIGMKSIGSERLFLVGGSTVLDQPVSLKIHYTRHQASGMKENRLRPYMFNPETGVWSAIPQFNIIFDEDGNPFNDFEDGGFVEISTKQLGYVYILCPDDDDDEKEKTLPETIVMGPNPARDQPVRFLNVPKEASIKIYSLNGELIASTRRDSINWDNNYWEWALKNDGGKNIVSGVYIVVAEYNGKTVKSKVAIIR